MQNKGSFASYLPLISLVKSPKRKKVSSITYITTSGGNEYQFLQYLPYGGIFVEQKDAGLSVPYLFNSKEYDEESGFYNYLSRYQSPEFGIFLSVDVLSDKFAYSSPYCYTLGNPVRYIDPDGRAPMDARGGGPPGGMWPGRNGLYTIGEGFRQMFQAAGSVVDRFKITLFGKSTTTTLASQKTFGGIDVEVRGDMVNEYKLIMGTNFEEFFDNSSGNVPVSSPLKLENKRESSFKSVKEVSGSFGGVEVTGKNELSTGGKSINTITLGIGDSGFFMSQNNNTQDGQAEYESTNVGVKGELSTPEVRETKITVGGKIHYEID